MDLIEDCVLLCVGFAEVSCSEEYSDLSGIDAMYGRNQARDKYG